ncbi:hypothetical protein F5Y06DRAFT_266702 [Hypoxylon sp. FL0890]|nr:hypothetical protein F5Y06DRAFT_266702 [Hypoxylon sp. FL0890]
MFSIQSQIIKPPHILDLPSEILAHIFSYVRPTASRDDSLRRGGARHFSSSPNEIKNIRLVCRRFCEESSHLLLPIVTVSINSTSLARLDEISLHPFIAQGIRMIVVVLSFFASDLANEFNEYFFYYQWRELRARVKEWGARTDNSNTPGCGDGNLAAVTKCRRILDSWNRAGWNSTASNLNDEDQRNMQLIRRAHEEYRHAYLEQERLRTTGSFVQAVADAVARMPLAKSLYITDREPIFKPPSQRATSLTIVDKMANDDVFIANIVRPIAWAHELGHEFSSPPLELLSQIPLAIHGAGVKLTDVNYNISAVRDFSRFFRGTQDLKSLKIAMRQLTSFTFELAFSRDDPGVFENFDYEGVTHFVEAFIDTDSIQSIGINMGTSLLLSAGSLLLTRTWPRLRHVYFQSPLHFEELREFYARIQRPVEVELDGVYLLSGSWADVLDIMRANPPPQRQISSFCIRDPHGAECSTMTGMKRYEIFDNPFHNRLGLYIERKIRDNPLRQPLGDADNEIDWD